MARPTWPRVGERGRPHAVTWAGLDVDDDEKRALRRAGVAPGELARTAPVDLVDVTDGVVTPARADELSRRATLLEVMTPAKVALCERLGVVDRADLATRSVDNLFLRLQDVSPGGHPGGYVMIGALIEAARDPTSERATDDWWKTHCKRTGIDPVRLAWEHRFGPAAEPTSTAVRLRLPSIGVQARVAVGSVPPIDPRAVSVDDARVPTRALGHWVWAGKHGAFLDLDRLAPGDPVELGARYEVVEVRRGAAPVDIGGDLVLTTPPHLRWAQHTRGWDLADDVDPELDPVQVAVGCRRFDP